MLLGRAVVDDGPGHSPIDALVCWPTSVEY